MTTSETPTAAGPQYASLKPIHFVYAAALVASGSVAFEIWGFVASALIGAAWGFVFVSRSRPPVFMCVVAMAVGIAFCSGVLLPSVQTSREAARRSTCKNHLKQFGLALHNYHDTYESFPPAVVKDEHGQPMHSWRTLILPYIDQAPLHYQYDFEEPWNGPHNRKLVDVELPTYMCPSVPKSDVAERRETSYIAVVGANTFWPTDGVRSFRDVPDGNSNTILLIECHSQDLPWAEPRDVTLEEALDLLTSTDIGRSGGHGGEDYFYEYSSGRHVLMGDGAVRFYSHGLDRDVWRNLLVVNDGVVEEDEDAQTPSYRDALQRRRKPWRHVKFWTFVVLALFPLPWVFINPSSGLGESAVDKRNA